MTIDERLELLLKSTESLHVSLQELRRKVEGERRLDDQDKHWIDERIKKLVTKLTSGLDSRTELLKLARREHESRMDRIEEKLEQLIDANNRSAESVATLANVINQLSTKIDKLVDGWLQQGGNGAA